MSKKIVALVYKDFLLSKKFLILIIISMAIFPGWVWGSATAAFGAFAPMIAIFVSCLYAEYAFHCYIAEIESRFCGQTFLCASGYDRFVIVLSKYVFILIVFLLQTLIFVITSFFFTTPAIPFIVFSISVAFMGTAVLFGIWLPLEYTFGYSGTKLILAGAVFLVPAVIFVSIRIIEQLGLVMLLRQYEAVLAIPVFLLGIFALGLSFLASYKKMVKSDM